MPLFFLGDTYGETVGDVVSTTASLAADGVYVYTDRSFDPATGTAKGLRTDFNFGTPAKGYASEKDRPEKQRAEYKAFIEKEIFPTLSAAARRGEKNRKDGGGGGGDVLGVTFGGPIITEYEIVRALIQDVSLAGFGLAVVAVYMWAHMNGSVFLTLAGMFEIAISFPAAYFLYRVVMGLRYVSILQFLSVFVILGIGVDDVFVFYDTYAQATAATGRDTDLVLRLSYAYKHAGRAMLAGGRARRLRLTFRTHVLLSRPPLNSLIRRFIPLAHLVIKRISLATSYV